MIRLNLGSHPPKFWDAEGREVHSEVGRGETVIHHQVRYVVCINLTGTWAQGCAEPMWVMTDLGLFVLLKQKWHVSPLR